MGDFNFDDYKDKGRRNSRRPNRKGAGRDSDRRSSNRGKPQRRDFRPRSSESRSPHTAICDSCGESCEVPFKPTAGKPVYCDECFKKNKGSDFNKKENTSSKELEQINKKLDKILELLQEN